MLYYEKHEKKGHRHPLIFIPRFWPRNASQSLKSVTMFLICDQAYYFF